MEPGCSYCLLRQPWATDRDHGESPTQEELIRAFDYLDECLGPMRVVGVCGEPMSDRTVVEVLAHVAKRNRVDLVTNAIAPLGEWDVFPRNGNVALITSYHWEHWSIPQFLAKLEALEASGLRSWQVPLVAVPWEFEAVVARMSVLRAAGREVVLRPFCGQWKGENYPPTYAPEQQAIILGNNAVDETPSTVCPQTCGKLCWAGVHYLCVSWNGDVHRCYRVDELDPIGNMREPETIVLPTAPAPCEVETCNCAEMWRYIVDLEEAPA
jgi:hypothetical protein